MKKFKYSFSTFLKVLLIIATGFTLAGLVLNVINLVKHIDNSIQIIIYSVSILVTLLINFFAVSILFFGEYVIDEKNLTLKIGLIKNKTPLEEIVAITLFKKSNKLVLYFADQKYTVIVIKPERYDQFILELRSKNSKIIYNSQIDGEDTPN